MRIEDVLPRPLVYGDWSDDPAQLRTDSYFLLEPVT